MNVVLKNHYRIMIWGGIYAAFICIAYRVSVQMQGKDFIGFLYGNLFKLQKYFWDVSFFFHTYLFLLKKPFSSPMFVARCKQNYFSYVIGYGVQICGFYVAFTMLLFYGIPIFSGFPVTINGNIIIQFFHLFSFLFTLYLYYLFLLIKTNRQMQSLLLVLGTNLFVLMFCHALESMNHAFAFQMEHFLIKAYPGLAVCMLFLTRLIVKRKEWLNDEK